VTEYRLDTGDQPAPASRWGPLSFLAVGNPERTEGDLEASERPSDVFLHLASIQIVAMFANMECKIGNVC
jgi:hypothetical protein